MKKWYSVKWGDLTGVTCWGLEKPYVNESYLKECGLYKCKTAIEAIDIHYSEKIKILKEEIKKYKDILKKNRCK